MVATSSDWEKFTARKKQVLTPWTVHNRWVEKNRFALLRDFVDEQDLTFEFAVWCKSKHDDVLKQQNI